MSDYMVDETSGPVAIRYRKIVMWIHWITAILVIMQVYIGFTFHDLPRGLRERAFVFGWHKTWGALILVLALARLAVRLINPPPPYPVRLSGVEARRGGVEPPLLLRPADRAAADRARRGVGPRRGRWVPLQLGLKLPAIPGHSPRRMNLATSTNCWSGSR